MAFCGVSIWRETSFTRNILNDSTIVLHTHMHSKNICLIASSNEWQNEHRGFFILPKVKGSYSDIICYDVRFIENYVESYL